MMPQNPQMAAYTFAPHPQSSEHQEQQQIPQRERQKNYVFVDEQNRHKRLKVMRACKGCRRRKIKCDAATTNTWPCGACIRLKLNCVKPNDDEGPEDVTYEITPNSATNSSSQPQKYHDQGTMESSFATEPIADVYNQPTVYDPSHVYGQLSFSEPTIQQHNIQPPQHQQNIMQFHQPQLMNQPFASAIPSSAMFPITPPSMNQPLPQALHSMPPIPTVETTPQHNYSDPQTPGTVQSDYTADLCRNLGNLEINNTGTAPYLRNKASFRYEQPPPEEDEDDEILQSLPPMRAGKIRVPPELMPTDEQTTRYFDLYFTHIHPYLPVLSKPRFYEQWNNDRQSISPLILEVMFAFGARLADEGSGGQQWLAMASKHVDIFMDVPRLSTLQAVMMLMKARESSPQKGYYYRSWMNIVAAVQMARELGLDDHSENHNNNRPCDYPLDECRLKTRLWQVVFVLETMIGTAQGRRQLSIDSDQVDLLDYTKVRSEDPAEYTISRNFTFFSRLVREIGSMNTTYGRMHKKFKDGSWATDPEFIKHGPALNNWFQSLRDDLMVTFPSDNSPPSLPSAFTGNMLTYYFLSFILLHRPQLQLYDPTTPDYKRIMLVCSRSAKNICRLHEAVMTQYGMVGLQGMLRGYSYVVYCGLTCIVIHLAALTSPDPEINLDAGEFFSRHMRLLEKIMAVWSIPDLKKQIDGVRRAFSADTRKPFVLKPSFPYGSPASSHSSPPPMLPETRESPGMVPTMESLAASNFGHLNAPLQAAPPMGPSNPNNNPLMIHQSAQAVPNMQLGQAPVWNPNPLFEQWQTTFGQNSMARSPADSASPPQIQDGNTEMMNSLNMQNGAMTASQTLQQGYQEQGYQGAYMTPEMWQQSVASVYEGGMKRPWDYDGGKR